MEKEKKEKLKLAVYWGAACGGCCVSVLDVHERLLEIVAAADLVFWPLALDIKYKDVEEMPDGFICASSAKIKNSCCIRILCPYGWNSGIG
jgi:F420-non-reducing hydrogenase small subunit